jgi:hypothetical protein
LPFHGDRLYYCRSHCTHQLHMVGLPDTTAPPPPWCSSGVIGAPQSPLAPLNPRWHSAIPVGALQSRLALRYIIQRSIQPVLSTLILLDGPCSIPSTTSIRSHSIPFQTVCLPPHSVLLRMDGLLDWIYTL